MDSKLARARLFAFGLLAGLLAAAGILLVASRPAGKPVALLPPVPTATARPVRVHVSGEVVSPGVYSLPPGSLVQDAIAAAGGPTASGDPGRLNLAAPLSDGQQVVVPFSVGSVGPQPPAMAVAEAPPSPSNRVNINTATGEQLEALPEIGPAIAARIVAYRNAQGPFKTIEEIQDVSGIGPKTFDAIKDLITVAP